MRSNSNLPPLPLLSPFGAYPNPLQLTDAHRELFHPVLVLPSTASELFLLLSESNNNENNKSMLSPSSIIDVMDYTKPRRSKSDLVSLEQWTTMRRILSNNISVREEDAPGIEANSNNNHPIWTIGRYDENRVGLYDSEIFQNTANRIDGFDGARTVHVGIDLGGPAHTPVYSFWSGYIHAVGYNPERGDYGHVVVIHHDNLPSNYEGGVYALYGHLDSSALKLRLGDRMERGQVIAGLGDVHENGGWLIPHVHFQISISPPETHDMPGAVALSDRERALREYPDPRYVLGPLY